MIFMLFRAGSRVPANDVGQKSVLERLVPRTGHWTLDG